jgi:uncharacterized DUF497 family protein
MDSEFNPDKDAANIGKHGVPLAFGAPVFDDLDVLIVPTIREADEEERYRAIGVVDGPLWTAVHIYRGERVRFISVRRSNAGEQRAYDGDTG